MKIQNKKNLHLKRSLIATIVSILLITGLSIGYVYGLGGNIFGWQRNTTEKVAPQADSNIEDSPQTESGQQEQGLDIKSDTINKDGKSPDKNPSDSKREVSVTITSPPQQALSSFQIRSFIDSVQNTGTCTLVLKKGTFTLTKTTAIYASGTVSTCENFNISSGEISAGTWTVSVTYENDQIKGSVAQTITVE